MSPWTDSGEVGDVLGRVHECPEELGRDNRVVVQEKHVVRASLKGTPNSSVCTGGKPPVLRQAQEVDEAAELTLQR